MLVVIFILFGSLVDVDELVDVLEVCYLVNCDLNLYFGLFSDYIDVVSEILL